MPSLKDFRSIHEEKLSALQDNSQKPLKEQEKWQKAQWCGSDAVTEMGDGMGKSRLTRIVCRGAQIVTERTARGFEYPCQGACVHPCFHL